MSALAKKRVKSANYHKQSSKGSPLGMWVWMGIILAVGGALLIGFALTSSDSQAITESGVLDFTGQTLDGGTLTLSDYRGQVVMLNFWATWCPPCRAEMPSIEAAYEHYRDEGFMVLAINNSEYPSEVQPFADMLGLQFPIVLDMDARLQGQFNITGYPTSIFLDANGEVYATHTGALSDSQLIAFLEEGLARP